MTVDDEPDRPSLQHRGANQRTRSLSLAWLLAGLAATFYVMTIVKFDEQLDRAHSDRLIETAACADAEPSRWFATPSPTSRREPGGGAHAQEIARCG